MKIFQPLFLFLLFPLLTHAVIDVALAVVCKKVFATTIITESLTFITDIGKKVFEKWIQFKDDLETSKVNVTVEQKTKITVSETMEIDGFDAKTELFQVSEVIKQANDKMKASFKSVKSLMRDQHFQTHIQFPVESLVLHLEQFLSHPSNASEEDLRLTCTKTLPNSILKNLELMLKDNFLIHQSDLNPEIFAKLEKGIILMIKQLIFAQTVCLQIRHFDSSMDVQKVFGFHMVKNIEFYIKKQRMEVQTKFHLNTVFAKILKSENGFTAADSKNANASLFQSIGTKLCQKAKSSSNTSNVDFFLTRDFSDFTVISKNRYFKESYNGWKVYAFYPKFSLKQANRIENAKAANEIDEDDEERKSKNVLKNQIIFECKNEGHCSLMGNDNNGMYSNGMGKNYHYAICGNIGVTLGHPIVELRKAEELTVEEKAEIEKWEKTKAELTQFLKVQKMKDLEIEEKREKEKEELIEATIARIMGGMKAKDEIHSAAFVSAPQANGGRKNYCLNFVMLFFITAFCYLIL